MSDTVLHELVFTDREARPAKWQTRCGRTDVPLEQAISPLPGGYYQVTCPACLAGDAARAQHYPGCHPEHAEDPRQAPAGGSRTRKAAGTAARRLRAANAAARTAGTAPTTSRLLPSTTAAPAAGGGRG